ncbi:MAG: energy transducer TonB [Bacteroidia bacterium]|jgi:protein TonB|nr:energy transducer TonB [Bacteroidia bacterium]
MIVTNQQQVLDELVFEGRNQSYGAYVLRKSYPNHLNKAIAVVLALLCLFWGSTFLFKKPVIVESILANDGLKIIDVQLPNPKTDIVIEQPPSSGTTGAKRSGVFTIVKDTLVMPDPSIATFPKGIDSVATITTAAGTAAFGSANGKDSAGINTGIFETSTKQPFVTFAEVMPSFPGGDDEMFKYINQQTAYPNHARENGIEGRVMLSFIIQPNGEITNIKVLQGIGFGCDAEAVRVVSEMPKWNPGMQNGKALPVQLNLPFYFKLE